MSGSDFMFDQMKGQFAYYFGLPAANDAIIVVLLKAAGLEADSTMKRRTTLSDVLTGSGSPSTEANFTGTPNYARKSVTASVTVTIDNTANDWVTVSMPSQTWTAAGGAQGIAKLLVCYDGDTTGGTDANITPITAHSFDATTDGTDLTASVPASPSGVARAT